MNLQGRVAIVTGGASGLGRATVEELVRAGANVAIFDVQEDKAAALAAALGSSALPAAVDVTSEASVAAGIQQVMARFGAIHVCVNCAGVPHAARTVGREDKPFPLDLFVRVVTINLVGTFNVLRLAAAEMVKNAPSGEAQERGVIVNTASAAAFDGQVGQRLRRGSSRHRWCRACHPGCRNPWPAWPCSPGGWASRPSLPAWHATSSRTRT